MNNIKKIATITFHNSYNYGSSITSICITDIFKKKLDMKQKL